LNRSSSHDNLSRIGAAARRAAHAGNWTTVKDCAREILRLDKRNPEGWFLTGLLEKAAGRNQQAVAAFSKSIQFDAKRYDAAIELAALCQVFLRHREAVALLKRYEPGLRNSPYYLDMAANLYTRLGLHDKAWPLYRQANALQPDIDRFQANLAACAVNVGKIDQARSLYKGLLARHPGHQRNHYELSRLETARDPSHIERMKEVLETTRLPAEKNIFLYYAIAKELEDLGQWEEAFDYYERGGTAAAGVAGNTDYDVSSDIELIDRVIQVCNSAWLASQDEITRPGKPDKTPVFIVGLPRTGTTLTERIVASHSHVESADETFFMQLAIRRASGVNSKEEMTPGIIEAAAKQESSRIARAYLDMVDYRLGGWPIFIDKYPFNFLYLGFIAKAFPHAKIVHLRRNPMDACFAMYKQSYFRQAYTLEDVGRYYVAYDRLCRHWKAVLPGRVIEVEYEALVNDPEGQIRHLLDSLGLEFEQSCLDFHLNESPSATASKVQVREKAHTRSVNKWKNWEKQLEPLKNHLENAGISTG
jgi:tetratricopeptide (TPR) repeat protein